MASKRELRTMVTDILERHRLTFRQAGDDALDFEITRDGSVVLRFEDGEEELEPEEVEERVAEYADGLGSARNPPEPMAVFENQLQVALTAHLESDHDPDLEDECCYEALELAVEGMDLEELVLEEVGRLRFEEPDGTTWRVFVDDDRVRLDERDEDEEDDDDDDGYGELDVDDFGDLEDEGPEDD